MIIAIDGYASCGKSTLARDLAKSVGFRHIDSGAMYRATTYFLLENKTPLDDHKKVMDRLPGLEIDFEATESGSHVRLNGVVLKDELRSRNIDENVSLVAAIPEIREQMVKIQRSLGKKGNIVMDGRDIGSVVFPEAQLKLFIEATLPVRVERRYQELAKKGILTDRNAVETNLLERDKIDIGRKHSPLRKTEDAVVIDNSNLDRVEQLVMTKALAKYRLDRITSGKLGHVDT